MFKIKRKQIWSKIYSFHVFFIKKNIILKILNTGYFKILSMHFRIKDIDYYCGNMIGL